jgi:hypothetical protein
VILYEMLLGKVPFEGSSMGEVLMKHLTTQPEVEGLPKPFGKIIQKALQKDPKDRYQTVDEMVDELLAVDEVQKSLAGFSTKSLEGAVRRREPDHAQSPVPSPNPAPRNLADAAGQAGVGHRRANRPANLDARVELPERLAKRVERISRKVEKKVAKLDKRRPPPVPQRAARDGAAGAVVPPPTPLEHSERKRRMLLSLLLAVGLSVGLAVAVGNAIEEEAGVGSAMLVFAMAGGILLSRRVADWFSVSDGPKWAQLSVRLGCCAPLMAVGAAPLMAEVYGGVGVWLGMLVVAAFANWEKALDRSRNGEVNIWYALWTAFGGVIATAIAFAVLQFEDSEVEPLLGVAAGIAGVVSVILQSVSWWGPAAVTGLPRPAKSKLQPFERAPAPTAGEHSPEQGRAREEADGDATPTTDQQVDELPLHTRWGVTRALWGLIAFVLMGGAIVAFVATLVLGGCEINCDKTTGLIVVCVACVSAMIFAVRKTTPIKRHGFWQESVRPFLTSVALFGIGATITGIARNWDWLSEDQRGGVIAGLVVSSVLFLVSTFAPKRQSCAPKPFFVNPCGVSCCGPVEDDKDPAGAGGEASPDAE